MNQRLSPARTRRPLIALLALLGTAGVLSAPAPASAEADQLLLAEVNAVPDSWIVHLRPSSRPVEQRSAQLASAHSGEVVHTYESLSAFSATMDERHARALAARPEVERVEQNVVEQVLTQRPAPTHLDRIDQRVVGDMDDRYLLDAADVGEGTTIYVVDTGVNTAHTSFQGRAVMGADFTDDAGFGVDCNGHGTAVAALASADTWGVARGTRVVGVKTHDCACKSTSADVLAGLEWIADHQTVNGVVNLSTTMRGYDGKGTVFVDTLKRIQTRGTTVVKAIGNDNRDLCVDDKVHQLPGVIVVAGTAISSGQDVRWVNSSDTTKGSGYGACVDVFAPGKNIRSAGNDDNAGSELWTGTSMAAPQVAGAAAWYRSFVQPVQVEQAIKRYATTGAVTDARSPNNLLRVAGRHVEDVYRYVHDGEAIVTNGVITTSEGDRYFSRAHVRVNLTASDLEDTSDLRIELLTQSGAVYVLKEPGAPVASYNQEYEVPLNPAESRFALWRLRVTDAVVDEDVLLPPQITTWVLHV